MIVEGLKLLLLGMSVVYVFLVLLYGTIALSGRLLRGITEAEFAPARRPVPGSGVPPARGGKEIIAAITSAITAFRKDRNIRS